MIKSHYGKFLDPTKKSCYGKSHYGKSCYPRDYCICAWYIKFKNFSKMSPHRNGRHSSASQTRFVHSESYHPGGSQSVHHSRANSRQQV